MSNIWSFAGLHLQLSSECDSSKSNYLDSGIRRELLDSDVSDTGRIIRLLVLEPLLSNSVAVKMTTMLYLNLLSFPLENSLSHYLILFL